MTPLSSPLSSRSSEDVDMIMLNQQARLYKLVGDALSAFGICFAGGAAFAFYCMGHYQLGLLTIAFLMLAVSGLLLQRLAITLCVLSNQQFYVLLKLSWFAMPKATRLTREQVRVIPTATKFIVEVKVRGQFTTVGIYDIADKEVQQVLALMPTT